MSPRPSHDGMAETEVVDGGSSPPDPTVLPRKRHRGRFLRFMGLLFIVSALALVGYLWWNVWGNGYAARAAQNDLRPAFERNVASLQPAAAPQRVVSVPGRAIAIIRIPKIDVDLVVVEGTGTEQLKKDPAITRGRPTPGTTRVASGSRDTGRPTEPPSLVERAASR